MIYDRVETTKLRGMMASLRAENEALKVRVKELKYLNELNLNCSGVQVSSLRDDLARVTARAKHLESQIKQAQEYLAVHDTEDWAIDSGHFRNAIENAFFSLTQCPPPAVEKSACKHRTGECEADHGCKRYACLGCATCHGKGYVWDEASPHFPRCLDCAPCAVAPVESLTEDEGEL